MNFYSFSYKYIVNPDQQPHKISLSVLRDGDNSVFKLK